MSYSLDTNLLLYASDQKSDQHPKAKAFLEGIPSDPDLLYLTWPCLMGYLRISTHPGIFDTPLSPAEAWGNVVQLLNLPRTRTIDEGEDFAETYRQLKDAMVIRGNLVPDAHLAALLIDNGVTRLYSTCK